MWLSKQSKTKVHCEEERTCNYSSLSECPYNTPKECKFNKNRCLHQKEKKHYISSDPTRYRLIATGLIALLLFVLIHVYSAAWQFPYCEYVYPILSTIMMSIIAGVILTFAIDLPTRLKDYEKSFVQALSSSDYLKTLDEQRLTTLRNDITEQLHKASAPCMAKGLIDMDQKICELLRLPYYSRYRHSVICDEPDGEGFIVKEHTIDYKLINPYGVNKEAKEILQSTNLVKLLNPSSTEEQKKVLDILEFKCSVDNKEPKDLIPDCKVCYEPIKEDEYYNTKVYIKSSTAPDETPSPGIVISFTENIQVHLRYKIRVCKEDRCFTKRLQHPVKNFRLDYSCKDKDAVLYGQIFGTEMKQSDMSIRSVSNNTISLECFDWLLPQNGTIVVML